MSIAEQLRRAYHNDLTDVPLLIDAAEEIERLNDRAEVAEHYNGHAKAEIARLKEALALEDTEWMHTAHRLAAEVERLKAALTAMIEIIDAAGRIDVIGQTSWYVKASDAARAALEAKP